MIPQPGEIRTFAVTENGDLELGIGREDSYEEFVVTMSVADLIRLATACTQAANSRLEMSRQRLEVREEVDPL